MSTKQTQRQEWMAALALADEGRLRDAWDSMAERPDYQVVRGPETGLVMIRARSGNVGERFNLGEMTVTRCSVGLAGGVMGHAFIGGMKPGHACLAAVFDALMQLPERREELRLELIEPLLRKRREHLIRRHDEVLPSRVDFFTLVRGEE